MGAFNVYTALAGRSEKGGVLLSVYTCTHGGEIEQLKAENEVPAKERNRLREDKQGLLEAGAHLL
ncbi:hypothetical protein G7009_01235 [Pseudomonas capeferrum]|uniref:hypothetical protein n=1 Tax=Pseudomonas capeferrum TaxID=1495066 RepID=UPI0015E48864|nr:hypothetical protein [Pseudomonas capeferrum]MBA1200426.1 hypothetical protein [Pseudomonas capeferrum]